DETTETDAAVPEEFMRYQWTRLAGGEPTPEFVAQVKRLLEAPKKPALKTEHPKPPTLPPHFKSTPPQVGSGEPARQKKGLPGWAIGALVAVVVGLGVAVFSSRQPAPDPRPQTPDPKPALVTIPVAPINDKSIAVLPFENRSEDKANAYFTDGIHEDILTNLALIRELRVVSRTSVMQYRATTKPMKQIAQELGVTYILEGSVRRSGNKVRVTGQLIHAATDEHLWAQSYDRDLTDVFAIQSEVSRQIAGALKTALSPEEKKLIEHRPTENLAAYESYTKARQILSSGNQRNFDQLVPLLTTATLLDPKFAQAWAELGSVYARRYFDHWERTPEVLAKAKLAIEQAVALSPDDPTVISKLGDYYYYGFRDYPSAAAQYRKLTDQYPNFAPGFASLAFIHRRQGRWGDAMTELRRAVQLEPRNARYLNALAETAAALRLYDEAEATYRQLAAHDPENIQARVARVLVPFYARGSKAEAKELIEQFRQDPKYAARANQFEARIGNLMGDLAAVVRFSREVMAKAAGKSVPWRNLSDCAWNLWLNGDVEEARTWARQVVAEGRASLEKEPDHRAWFQLAQAYVVLGDQAEALRCTQAARGLASEAADKWDGPGVSLQEALILAALGEKDRALAEVARLLRTPGKANVHELRHNVDWHPLQGDPRFEALLNDPKNNEPLF
ncbi:MAG: TolB amino-terminal protein, partial [Verrucomicrobiota bacterium]|nr:TolB amino-terminal protein [Verrucomicrobiota bacterium]